MNFMTRLAGSRPNLTLLTLFSLLVSITVSNTALGAEITGILVERGTKVPVRQQRVYILPYKLQAETDEKGNFVFHDVPEGDFTFVVNRAEYQKLELTDSTSYHDVRKLYLEKLSYDGFETKIVSKADERDLSKQTMTADEFLTVPGANGDPVKAVQNLAGVNRVGGFASVDVIQGSAPNDTQYQIDGHRVPIIFHFGGFSSVVTPEAIKSVDLLTAGYDAQFSNALGGIIDLHTRDPEVADRDRKGFFFVDTLKSGGLFETKLSDTESLLVSGRFSYIGLFLKTVAKGNPDFNLTVAPEFNDFTSFYKNKISEKDELKVDLIGSRDTLGFLLKQPLSSDPTFRGDFNLETDFWRVIPQWSHKFSSDSSLKLSLGAGQDLILVDIGSDYYDQRSNVVTAKGEYEWKPASNWISQVGFDNYYDYSHIKLELPISYGADNGVRNPGASSTIENRDVNSHEADTGLYWRNEVALNKEWSVIPALRTDEYSTIQQTVVSPRFGVKYRWDDSLLLKAATGIYYQPPQPQESDSQIGNPDIRSPHAIHVMLGFEKDFRKGGSDGWQWNGSFFRRDFSQLVVPSSAIVVRNGAPVPEAYNNSGGGLAQGFQTEVRYNEGVWKGSLAYTLLKSQRWDPQHPVYNFEYDQTHNVNLIASREMGNNMTLSGRFRYVTGDPYTPINGAVFDSNNDVYLPASGSYYSRRYDDFKQLDLRFDKKWINDTEVWTFYVDVENVLNTKNTESLNYNYDYSQSTKVSDLPILPSIGIKGEF